MQLHAITQTNVNSAVTEIHNQDQFNKHEKGCNPAFTDLWHFAERLQGIHTNRFQ